MSRICFISKFTYPIDTRLRQQVRALGPSHSIDVLCLAYGKEPRRVVLENCNVVRVMQAKSEKSGFAGYILFTISFAIRCWAVLLGHVVRDRYDLIVVHTLPEFLIFAAVLNKLSGSRLILDVRDITVELLGSRWKKRRGARFIRKVAVFIEQCACAFADRLLVASSGFRQRLEMRGVPRDKMLLFMNTADHQIFIPWSDRRFAPITAGPVIMYHGTIAPRFGLVTAIEALAIINKTIPGGTLKIYGLYDAAYRTDLAGLVRAHRLQDNVLLGPIKELHEIHDIICQSDFGVVPYCDDEFMNLALSTKTFEYVASGLPVVASRLRSTSELFSPDCITYFNPDDASDLAEKILVLCRDPGLRKKRAQAALDAYGAWSGEVNARKFSATVKDLIEMRKV